MAVGFLLIVSLAVTAWINALGAIHLRLSRALRRPCYIASSVVSFLVIAGLFGAIYKVMPDVHIEWRDVILGGGVTSLLFTIGKQLLGLYLGRASYTSTYGAAASIVVLIAWVYYSAQIFFLGAEFTRTFARRYGSHRDKKPAEVQLASDVEGRSPEVLISEDDESGEKTPLLRRGPQLSFFNSSLKRSLCGNSRASSTNCFASSLFPPRRSAMASSTFAYGRK